MSRTLKKHRVACATALARFQQWAEDNPDRILADDPDGMYRYTVSTRFGPLLVNIPDPADACPHLYHIATRFQTDTIKQHFVTPGYCQRPPRQFLLGWPLNPYSLKWNRPGPPEDADHLISTLIDDLERLNPAHTNRFIDIRA